MTEELKPCPFCGGEAEFNSDEFGEGVCCKSCGATLHNGVYGEEWRRLASADWNARPIENELTGKIGKLKSENARLREALEFYALGKHLMKASGVVVCDAYDLVSGQVENGKYAQEALKGCAK